MRRTRANSNLIICPKTKQFTSLVVCAASCKDRCEIYLNSITLEILTKYVENHPEYKIVGELMVTKKTTEKKEKKFWIVTGDTFVEVTEKEIMNNPKQYLKKQIWEKPPFRYKVVISLKKIKD